MIKQISFAQTYDPPPHPKKQNPQKPSPPTAATIKVALEPKSA